MLLGVQGDRPSWALAASMARRAAAEADTRPRNVAVDTPQLQQAPLQEEEEQPPTRGVAEQGPADWRFTPLSAREGKKLRDKKAAATGAAAF